MEFKPQEIPIWQNKGEVPSNALLANGYKSFDVPYAKHLNYLFNRLTTNLNYYMDGAVHSKDGVLTTGHPVPLSDEGTLIKAESPYSVVPQGRNWYVLTSPHSEDSVIMNLKYYNAYPNMYLGGDKPREYSILLYMVELTDSPFSIRVAGLDNVWDSSSVKKFSQTPYAPNTSLTAFRITMTSKRGVVPTLDDLSVRLIVTSSGSSSVPSEISFMRPILYAGKSWSGNMNTFESSQTNPKDVFGFYDNSASDVVGITSSKYAPLGVSRLHTRPVGFFHGLPNDSDGVLFNMAREGSRKGAQMVMLDNKSSGDTELYFRAHMDNQTESTPFTKVATEVMVRNMLLGYATESYVSTQLKKYITLEDAKKEFVTSEASSEWQKVKITADDGSPLIVLKSTEDNQTLLPKLEKYLSVGASSIVSVSLHGGLFWGSSIISGLPSVTSSNYLLSYLDKGAGDPVYLSKADAPLVGFLQGTTAPDSKGYIHLHGELSTVCQGMTLKGVKLDGIPLATRVRVSINKADGTVSTVVWDSTDASTQAGEFNRVSRDYHTKYLQTLRDYSSGEVLYKGSWEPLSGTRLELAEDISKYRRIGFIVKHKKLSSPITDEVVVPKYIEIDLSAINSSDTSHVYLDGGFRRLYKNSSGLDTFGFVIGVLEFPSRVTGKLLAGAGTYTAFFGGTTARTSEGLIVTDIIGYKKV